MKTNIFSDDLEKQRLINEQLVKEDAKVKAEAIPVAPVINESTYPNVNKTVNTQAAPAPVIPVAPVINESTYPNVNKTVNTQAAPAPVIPVQVEQPSRAEQLIQQLYATKEPQPVVDQAKIDRLQRMGKLNSAGQAFGGLSDLFGSVIGANIRKREPDRITPMIYQQYENIMDKSNAENDAWRLRDFQTTRQNLIHGISEEHRKEAENLATARLKASSDLQKQKAEQDWTKFKLSLSEKDQERLDRNANNKENQKIGWARVAKMGLSEADKAANRPMTIIGDDGKPAVLSPEEVAYYKDYALKNKDELIKKYPGIVADEYPKNIVGQPDKTQSPKTVINSKLGDKELVGTGYNLAKSHQRQNNTLNLGQQPTTTAVPVQQTAPVAQPVSKPPFFQHK
jgi:hypothetical protein